MTGRSLLRWTYAGRTRLTFLIVLFSMVLFTGTADQPFHLDNMDFPAVAQAVNRTGVPVYYRGEEQPNLVGLYHPPLFIYTLAAWIHFFGFGHVQIRMLGFACAVIQALLALAIVRALLGRTTAARSAVWFMAAFLLNPYTLQGASIVDIDTTIYGPLLCGILLCAIRISWRDGVWRTDPVRDREFVWLAALIVLAFWAKLTTVILLLVVVPILLVARLGWRKTVLYWTACVVASMAIFSFTYALYGAVTGLDPMSSVQFTIQSFLTRGSSGRPGLAALFQDRMNNLAMMVPFHLKWTGLFPWVVAISALALTGWRAYRERSMRLYHLAVAIGFALFVTVFYCQQQTTFGAAPFKYTYVCWALILLCPAIISALLYGGEALFGGRLVVVAAGVFAVAALVGDLLIRDDLIYPRVNALAEIQQYVPAVLAAAAIALGLGGWRKASRVSLATALSIYAGVSFGIAGFQTKAPYSTTYDYGQTGFQDTVAFIRATTPPDGVIVSMKDIGFATGRRYFENYLSLYGGPDQDVAVKKSFNLGWATYAVFTENHGQDQIDFKKSFAAFVRSHGTVVKRFGDYVIYEVSGGPPPMCPAPLPATTPAVQPAPASNRPTASNER